MNTIPFDLEKCKAGYVAVDRNGDKYRFIAVCLDADKNHQLISLNISTYQITTRTLDGRFMDGQTSNIDFIGLLPQKKTAWVQKSLLLSDEEVVSFEHKHHFVKVEYYE